MVIVDVLPCDIRPVLVNKRRRNNVSVQVTIPPDIVKRYNLQDKDEILIAYLGPSNNDPTKKDVKPS